MPTARELRRVRYSRRRRATPQRTRRLAGLAVLAAVLVSLLLTGLGATSATGVAPAATSSAARLLPAGPPDPEIVAARGALRLQLPVPQTRLTAIGFHDGGALALEPQGRQGNRGLLGRLAERILGRSQSRLVWYQLGGGARSALDVGAAPGTDVFAPVNGTVVGIDDFVLDGRRRGVRVDIQPTSAPSLLVSVARLRPDPALTVGAPVVAAGSRLGTVVELSHLERQELARYTQDAGNHVTVEVRVAPTSALG